MLLMIKKTFIICGKKALLQLMHFALFKWCFISHSDDSDNSGDQADTINLVEREAEPAGKSLKEQLAYRTVVLHRGLALAHMILILAAGIIIKLVVTNLVAGTWKRSYCLQWNCQHALQRRCSRKAQENISRKWTEINAIIMDIFFKKINEGIKSHVILHKIKVNLASERHSVQRSHMYTCKSRLQT